MLPHATKTLTNAIIRKDMMAIKVSKEMVFAATANLAVANSGVREQQKLSQLSRKRKTP